MDEREEEDEGYISEFINHGNKIGCSMIKYRIVEDNVY